MKRIRRVLEIDRSSYYYDLAHAGARAAKASAEDEPASEIVEIHAASGGASGGAYGAIHVTREPRARGRVVNKKRVARIMGERGIAGITRRNRKSLTKADKKAHHVPVVEQRRAADCRDGSRRRYSIVHSP